MLPMGNTSKSSVLRVSVASCIHGKQFLESVFTEGGENGGGGRYPLGLTEQWGGRAHTGKLLRRP